MAQATQARWWGKGGGGRHGEVVNRYEVARTRTTSTLWKKDKNRRISGKEERNCRAAYKERVEGTSQRIWGPKSGHC